MRWPLLLVCFGLYSAVASAEPPIIFLVRHAERADAGSVAQKNPDLSAAGRRRARALAESLRDAKITAIYTTEFHRTQETAQPLAKRLGIRPIIVPAQATRQLIAALRKSDGNVLVVSHSNTLSEIMRALGVAKPPTLGEQDYDNLFLVLREPSPRLLRLHFSLGR